MQRVSEDNLKAVLKLIHDYEYARTMMGLRVPATSADLMHSALLVRMAEGKPMYKYPPPRCHSYPAYHLLEEGKMGACECFESSDPEFAWVIGQCGGWRFVKLDDEGHRVFRWSYYDLVVKAVPRENDDRWFDIFLVSNDGNPVVQDFYEMRRMPGEQ